MCGSIEGDDALLSFDFLKGDTAVATFDEMIPHLCRIVVQQGAIEIGIETVQDMLMRTDHGAGLGSRCKEIRLDAPGSQEMRSSRAHGRSSSLPAILTKNVPRCAKFPATIRPRYV